MSGNAMTQSRTINASWNVSARTLKSATYALFVGLFLAELLVSVAHADNILALQPWQLVALGIAAFRGARSVSYNNVFEWLRRPFCNVVPDSSYAGDSVIPKNDSPILYVIGDLLACPICSGTHVASIILAMVAIAPQVGLVLVYALCAAGISEILHWFAEKQEWEGRLARELSGTEWKRKNGK